MGKKRSRKKSTLLEAFKHISDNYSKSLNIVLFDALFIAVMFIFGAFVSRIPLLQLPAMGTGLRALFAFTLVILYFLVLTLIYSFFKYYVMNSIRSSFKERQWTLKDFKKFYWMNMLLVYPAYAVFGFIAALLSRGIHASAKPYAGMIYLIITFCLMSAYLNTTHSVFEYKRGIRKSLKIGLGTAFSRIPLYYRVFGIELGAFIVVLLLFLLIGWIASKIFVLPPAGFISGLNMAFGAVTIIMFYCTIFYNRIYFFMLKKEIL